ncbi:MAG: DUF3526 domain-containing protein [Aquimonas sp.]|nr:DUF3526 domain-containing protein [Aquimonas sp.]
MGRLIRLEWLMLARERLAWVLLGFLALACVLAVFNGRALMSQQLEGRAIAAQGDAGARERVQGTLVEGSDPALAILIPFWIRMHAVAPPAPLVDFSAGRAPFEPGATTITLRSREDTLFESTVVDNPELLARGSLDLGFVAIVLVPLALISLGYGLFSADRERGSARLLLAQGGSPVRLLFARSLPRLLFALGPLLVAAAVLLAAGPEVDGRTAAAGWWLLTAVMLALLWWAVVLLVNSFRVGAETAALVLVSLWAVFTLVLPAAITAAVQVAYPPPSRFEQIATARAAEVASTTAYEDAHPEMASAQFERRLASIRKTLAIGRSVEQATAPINRRFDQQLDGQQHVARWLAWLSPPLLAADAMTATAGTDVRRSLAFRRSVSSYLLEVKEVLGGFVERGEVMTRTDYEALPTYQWQAQPGRPAGRVAALGILTLVIGGFAVARLRRAKP